MNDAMGRVSIGAAVGIGMIVGGLGGLAVQRIALGVGIGAGIGLALGYWLRWRRRGTP